MSIGPTRNPDRAESCNGPCFLCALKKIFQTRVKVSYGVTYVLSEECNCGLPGKERVNCVEFCGCRVG